MAGIPPLIGFFAKYEVLYSSIYNEYYFLSAIAILASVISAAYYLRVVRVLYAGAGFTNNDSINSLHRYLIAILTLAVMLFVLDPSLILN